MPWLAGSVAVAAAAATLVSGCGSAASSAGASSSGPGSADSSSSTSSSDAAKTMTAREAVKMAARTSQQINSASSTLAIKVTGPATETTTGRMQLQLKPSTLMSAALTVTTGGKSIPVDEVLGSKAVYVKVPGVAQLTGKPWLAISFAELSGKLGASFGQLLQSMQNGNPFDQARAVRGGHGHPRRRDAAGRWRPDHPLHRLLLSLVGPRRALPQPAQADGSRAERADR